MLQPNERIDQLYADDIKIIQSSEVFSFSLDAVLLANYARVPKRGVIVDLCAGNGAVGLFISKKTTAHIYQVELQERLADMAQRSIELNDLQDQLTVYPMDLKNLFQKIKPDSVDLLVCNPPYFKNVPTAIKNPNPYLAIARHEITTTLDEVIQTASKALKNERTVCDGSSPGSLSRYFGPYARTSNRTKARPLRLSESRQRGQYFID